MGKALLNSNIFYELKTNNDVKGKEVVLFFHGFPGRTTKNEDLATKFYQNGLSTFLYHYEGLGKSSGVFSFRRCLNYAHQLTESLFSKFDRVHILGHSWGGFVAGNVFATLSKNRGHLMLLNPLTQIPPDHFVRSLVLAAIDNKELPDDYLGEKEKEDFLLNEINELRNEDNLEASLSKVLNDGMKDNIHIFLANKDALTPPELAQQLCKNIGVPYQKFTSDHWFRENREQLVNSLMSIFG